MTISTRSYPGSHGDVLFEVSEFEEAGACAICGEPIQPGAHVASIPDQDLLFDTWACVEEYMYGGH